MRKAAPSLQRFVQFQAGRTHAHVSSGPRPPTNSSSSSQKHHQCVMTHDVDAYWQAGRLPNELSGKITKGCELRPSALVGPALPLRCFYMCYK